MFKIIMSVLLLVFLSTLLTACSLSPSSSRFYSIAPLAAQALKSRPQLSLGIGPVQIPRLLRRPQLIVRKSPTEIDLVEKHQWGGSLREDLTRAFTDNLATLLGTEKIETYPWKHDFKPNYQIRINIEQLDGDLDKTVTLKARWRLMRSHKVIKVKHSTIQVAVNGKDYNAYVKAQSEAVYRLSQEIAKNI